MTILEKGGFLVLYLLLILHNESFATPVVKAKKVVATQQLPRGTVPIAYDIKLVLMPLDEYPNYHGESAITVRVLEQTRKITLHSKHLSFDEAFTSLVSSRSGKVLKATKHSFVNEPGFLVIEFGKPIGVGIFTLKLKYTGEFSNGIYFQSYPDGNDVRGFVETSFYPSKARTAFPCWDDVNHLATFNVSIKHDPTANAMSNTPVHQRISDADGKIWTKFETTLPIPAYRLEFVLSEFDCARSPDKKFVVCGRRHILPTLENVLDITQRVVPILQRYIGVPYSKRAMNQFVSPVNKFRPWTSMVREPIKYTESDFNADNTVGTMEKKTLAVARNVAYELLRDAVTVKSLNNSWILESLAYYLGHCVVDELYPDWREMDSFVMKVQDFGFDNDDLNKAKPLESNPDENEGSMERKYKIHEDESAIRGAALFHMISNLVGKNTFTKGIHEFVHKASGHSITSDDLWNEMQLEFNKNPEARHFNVQIKTAMHVWASQAGYPIVKATRDYRKNKVTLKQEGYPTKSSRFWIPMNFAIKSNPNFMKTFSWWMNPRMENSVIDDTGINAHDWIIFNLQQSGYYRVDYDETNWNKIAESMHTKQIPVRTRAQLINDLSFMVRNGRQNITTFLNFAKYLVDEDDFLPWFPVVKHVEWLRTRTTNMDVDKLVQEFYLGLMDKVARKIDFGNNGVHNEVAKNNAKNNKDFFTTRHNTIMRQFACDLGHPCCFSRTCTKAPVAQKPAQAVNTAHCGAAPKKDLYDQDYVTYILCTENQPALWEFVNKTLSFQMHPPGARTHIAIVILIEQSNNVNYFIENANTIYRYFDGKMEHAARDEIVTDIMVKLLKAASTPEQLEKVLDLVVKNPKMNPLGTIQPDFIQRRKAVVQWQKINFPVIRKWLHDHPISKPVA